LGVRHSYKPGLTLLYGGARWREDHRRAAARELREEVGITIDRDAMRLVFVTPDMHLYELRLTEKPELQIAAARSSKPVSCTLVCCARCVTGTRSASMCSARRHVPQVLDPAGHLTPLRADLPQIGSSPGGFPRAVTRASKIGPDKSGYHAECGGGTAPREPRRKRTLAALREPPQGIGCPLRLG